MQNNKFKISCKQGFTLIELLVVVLIIGILAAVAVPQYQKAVEKSRFSNYRTLASAVVTAVETFYLTNGTWPTSFDELSVDLPADMNIQNDIDGGICRKNNKFFCCMSWPVKSSRSGTVKCGDNEYHLLYGRGYADTDETLKKSMSCQAKEEKYKAICKSMSVQQEPKKVTYISTPDGLVSGYFSYALD